ncbi:hypothetical protein Tco_0824311 [Tanacetum coccineum]|uniref:Uncharacterized protein n=1 Tax=Tanacetum coccineum TaxID=301880 RepID=A0ABQ5ANE5_9ASTR
MSASLAHCKSGLVREKRDFPYGIWHKINACAKIVARLHVINPENEHGIRNRPGSPRNGIGCFFWGLAFEALTGAVPGSEIDHMDNRITGV